MHWISIVPNLILFYSFCSTGAVETSVADTVISVESRQGTVHMRIIGEISGKKIPVICLPGANPTLKDEWVPIASQLASRGYVSVLIYTHSFHKPLNIPDIISFLHEVVLIDKLGATRAIIMGKSAGGSLAQDFALQYPHVVEALVLAAPARTNPEHITKFCSVESQSHNAHFPVFLAWALDDPSFQKSRLWVDACEQRDGQAQATQQVGFTMYTATSGGHRVLPEYGEPIVDFLTSHHLSAK
mmetsp:Transcript_7421/g.12479  ORF Transcript_7421/g.12479 Transcript_7421/m.12479 type:complete len:243 (-) Transcript_7421:206-934(-)